jgi:hypothetical protein
MLSDPFGVNSQDDGHDANSAPPVKREQPNNRLHFFVGTSGSFDFFGSIRGPSS